MRSRHADTCCCEECAIAQTREQRQRTNDLLERIAVALEKPKTVAAAKNSPRDDNLNDAIVALLIAHTELGQYDGVDVGRCCELEIAFNGARKRLDSAIDAVRRTP